MSRDIFKIRDVTYQIPEGFLLVVDIADMSLQIGRDGEGAVAVLALVRLLARVRPQMAGQVGRAREDLSAKLARIAVAGFVDPRTSPTDDGWIRTRSSRRSTTVHQLIGVVMMIVVVMMVGFW